MTDQKDSPNLGKIVFDDNNEERTFWACLGQTCSRSLIVFLSQLSVILLIIFGCFWRIHVSRICDESAVWVLKNQTKIECSFHWSVLQKLGNFSFYTTG